MSQECPATQQQLWSISLCDRYAGKPWWRRPRPRLSVCRQDRETL